MFGIGMPELIIILVIALVVIGPKKLPDLAKALGKGLSEFKKATTEIKEGLNLDEDLKEAREDLVDAVSGLDEPPDLKKTEDSKKTADLKNAETADEKSPKFEDYDEMLDAYQQEKATSITEAEKVPSLKDAEEKDRPEVSAEKDRNG
ncbi:MAG: twin-arginine translocase TatA/TatE family subunit [Deltaproteobacteria bacterium]|nr:twin-arginine translocase TatA/TatE family subunit [Deltaproteobacteria bacterium]